MTINKVCGSGLKAVALAAQSIRLGEAEVVVAGGMESMSRAPYIVPRGRYGYRMGHGELLDSMINDGLHDCMIDCHMGVTAEHLSDVLCHQPGGRGPLLYGEPGAGRPGNGVGALRGRDNIRCRVPGRRGRHAWWRPTNIRVQSLRWSGWASFRPLLGRTASLRPGTPPESMTAHRRWW